MSREPAGSRGGSRQVPGTRAPGMRSFLSASVVDVDEHMKVLLGGGGNSIVLHSLDGSRALVVDTKFFGAARRLRSSIRAREITVVNTHSHMDHRQGNRLYAGARFVLGEVLAAKGGGAGIGVGEGGQVRTVATGQDLTLEFEGETVHVVNMGRAHSAEDCIVYFQTRRLLAAGDLLFAGWHPPYADPACSVALWMAALQRLERDYEARIVVPGHGNICDRTALAAQRKYFLEIGEALQDPDRLRQLRQRYAGYYALPLMSGFKRTVALIRKQAAAGSR